MNMEIENLDDISNTNYAEFVNSTPCSMMFHTTEYQEILKRLTTGQVRFLIAIDNGQVQGILPFCATSSKKFGTVINSLPFFGSPAGIAADQSLSESEQKEVYTTLLRGLRTHAEEQDIDLAVLITSQFDPHNESTGNPLYTEDLEIEFSRNRTAQVVEFFDYPENDLDVQGGAPDETPTDLSEITTVEEYLFSKFEKRCRRAIRKSYSAGLSRETSTNFRPLHEMHKMGMEAKGGTVKPYEFFELVKNHIPSDRYELSYARKDGAIIGGLFTFRFGDTVEYHTPAYDYEHRSDQATSFLIFEAMKEAVQSGIKYWNFGGTRPSQESLYRFKRGWGAVEYPYHYYGFRFGDVSKIKNSTPEELTTAFPWFYVYPFDKLESA